MQFRGAAIFTAVALSFTAAASAQKPGSAAPPPAPATNGNTTGNTNTRQPSSNFPNDSTAPQVIFISGTVVLSDGLPLPDRVRIERVCTGPPRIETYTDKKGHFSFQVGQSLEMQDASSPSSFGLRSPLGGFNDNTSGPGQRGGFNERELWGCQLQAVLLGFRSDAIPLANIQYLDNPDIGTIILHRFSGKVRRPDRQRMMSRSPPKTPANPTRSNRAGKT